jgi:hypothetical protein
MRPSAANGARFRTGRRLPRRRAGGALAALKAGGTRRALRNRGPGGERTINQRRAAAPPLSLCDGQFVGRFSIHDAVIFSRGRRVLSVGKGLASASVGSAAAVARFKVRHRKLDPNINVDPGTMSPYQHCEVYVTDDGAGNRPDLGIYERFTGVSTRQSDRTSPPGASIRTSSPASDAATTWCHHPGHSAHHRASRTSS